MAVYVPAHFAASDRAAIARLVHDHPFATLITPAAPEPQVTHLPLLHVADCEPHGTLLGHFARANPHWRQVELGEAIAVFHGPHAYVSPSWYAEPDAAVPTWNYAVVHAHGPVSLARDDAQTLALLDLMIHRFESGRAAPWTIGLTEARLAAMAGAIVGFRLKVKRIEAKFKMSQNRSAEDRGGVADALAREPYADSHATAAWMKAMQAPDPDATG